MDHKDFHQRLERKLRSCHDGLDRLEAAWPRFKKNRRSPPWLPRKPRLVSNLQNRLEACFGRLREKRRAITRTGRQAARQADQLRTRFAFLSRGFRHARLQLRRGRRQLGQRMDRFWLVGRYFKHLERYHEPGQKKYRLRIRLSAGTALLLMLAIAGVAGRPVYHHLKQKHELAEARQFLAMRDYDNARICADLLLQSNPANVDGCQIMAELADRQHSPAVLDWQQRIVKAEPTLEHKLELARADLVYDRPPYPLAAQIVGELAATTANLPEYEAVAGCLAMAIRNLPEAEARFSDATRLEPTNQIYLLNLALVWLNEADATKADAGRTRLQKLSVDPVVGPDALRTLIEDRLAAREPQAALVYSAQLTANPGATLTDQFQNLAIVGSFQPTNFTARLQAVQSLAATNPNTSAQVAAWMRKNNLAPQSLQWLEDLPVATRTQAPVQVALAEGYLTAQNWQALQTLVTQGNWNDLDFYRQALVSHAWAEQGSPELARQNWANAVQLAGSHPKDLAKLLSLAETWGLTAEKEQLLVRLVQAAPQDASARQALAKIYFDTGNTAGMYQLFARLSARSPNDLECLNNLAATELLLQTNVTQACQSAQQAAALDPGNPAVATTYAYSLHLQGRDQAGLALLRQLPPALLADPTTALYYGLLLQSSGQTAAALPYLRTAQTGQLWPEEKALLAKALAQNNQNRS